ncbi:MAG TPA: hypothetical protein VD994_03515 [Prosthecobacter sp.]|nr:hypothetical protein [Prosthecobacter sp.]
MLQSRQTHDQQLIPFFDPAVPDRLTVEQLLGFLFRHHLAGKPSARPFNSNRKAWCKTSGHIYYDAFTEPDAIRHISQRSNGGPGFGPVGPQSIRHDIKLMVLAHNIAKRWKRRRYVLDGFDFGRFRMPEENPFEEIERPKAKPRKRPVTPNQFSLWIEHASERLKRNSYFAMDTGLSTCELERLRPRDYNAATDCLDLQRGKTGEVGSIPVSDRCRAIILEAIREGRQFILDFTNHDKEVEETRRRSGVYFWFGRDLRTTYYNEILRRTGRNYRAAQRAMLHKDPRTGPMHYEVDDGQDLRPAIQGVEKTFSPGGERCAA